MSVLHSATWCCQERDFLFKINRILVPLIGMKSEVDPRVFEAWRVQSRILATVKELEVQISFCLIKIKRSSAL